MCEAKVGVKRLVAEVPAPFFWEAKAFSATNQINQRDMIAIAVYRLIQSYTPLDLIFDPEALEHLKSLGLLKEEE